LGIEKSFQGKIGVYAIDTNQNQMLSHRADELFPMQSTLKFVAVSALLTQQDAKKINLQEKIHYTKKDLMFWHPITGKHLDEGMTLEELSEAAVSYSDNPAANIIIKKIGGPSSITQFMHTLGYKTFHVMHYEGNLNSDPNNTDDTVTPKDMALSVQQLTLNEGLLPATRAKLLFWMQHNTTGNLRMRSGVPIGSIVADKTGSGDFGVANDIGLIWSPACKPIVLAIYTIGSKKEEKPRDDIVAATTRIVLEELEKNNACFRAAYS
jgi:beta-lactamase class A